MTTRDEHMQWCKERALAYLSGDSPNPTSAVTSMISDLSKHPETKSLTMGALGALALHSMGSVAEARRFIEGC